MKPRYVKLADHLSVPGPNHRMFPNNPDAFRNIAGSHWAGPEGHENPLGLVASLSPFLGVVYRSRCDLHLATYSQVSERWPGFDGVTGIIALFLPGV